MLSENPMAIQSSLLREVFCLTTNSITSSLDGFQVASYWQLVVQSTGKRQEFMQTSLEVVCSENYRRSWKMTHWRLEFESLSTGFLAKILMLVKLYSKLKLCISGKIFLPKKLIETTPLLPLPWYLTSSGLYKSTMLALPDSSPDGGEWWYIPESVSRSAKV